MPSTFTTNLNLELQGTGENSGTWGAVLNSAALAIVDQAMGGVQTLSLSSSNVTVTTSQSQNNAFKLTGTLTANVDVTFPAIGRTYFVANNTTGNFTVTLKCAGGGTSAVIEQGRNGFFILDAVNVIAQAAGIPSGMMCAFAYSSPVPSGWLYCNGQAVSRTTYSALFALIGITYGAGDGTTTFNVPDMRAYWMRGWDDGRGIDTGRVMGSNQAEMIGPHTHSGTTGNDSPDHTHGYTEPVGNSGAGGGGFITTRANSTTNGASNRHQHPFTTNNNSGTENRVINVAVAYFIKT